MSRFPEQIQFRAAPGTSAVLQKVAEAEGKRPGEVVREALAARLDAAKASQAAVSEAA